MLRFDSCWPANVDAVASIEAGPERRSVRLRTIGPAHNITSARWSSFLWPVMTVNPQDGHHGK